MKNLWTSKRTLKTILSGTFNKCKFSKTESETDTPADDACSLILNSLQKHVLIFNMQHVMLFRPLKNRRGENFGPPNNNLDAA